MSAHRVKIYGAGSIGNHLAHASRQLGWSVTVCDVSQAALERMKNEIYPKRYGQWDSTIGLALNDQAPKGNFDFILIGTPPEYHVPLALEALGENPRAILIEKPLCSPSMEKARELWDKSLSSHTKIFVGYTHVVGRAAQRTEEVLKSGVIGQALTLDVEFREHWEGIFKAHPWLRGPEDSYLGHWTRGGGASGEHSHAINLWQHFAHVLGFGRVAEVQGMLHYVTQGRAVYDDECLLNLRTEKGVIGRVIQDVITRPARKRAFIQGTEGTLEWVANYNAEGDAVIVSKTGGPQNVAIIPKTRPDDFMDELKHLEQHSRADAPPSPLRLERGLDTMLVLSAAHCSEAKKTSIPIESMWTKTESLVTS